MHKKLLVLVLSAAVLICSGCGGEKTPEADPKTAPEISAGTVPETPPDLSGTYTDRLGTDDIYSKLELSQTQDGTYSFSLSLYRLALLEGAAVCEDGTLHFINEQPHVEGEITVSGQEAAVTVTQSDLPGITEGDIYLFPDGPAG
ncbi:MAG: hypothetical protein K2O18_02505 [Oscillospiraceae bacterium]|nr:hypothetical protein [Oscillospiraceae bacterium]